MKSPRQKHYSPTSEDILSCSIPHVLSPSPRECAIETIHNIVNCKYLVVDQNSLQPRRIPSRPRPVGYGIEAFCRLWFKLELLWNKGSAKDLGKRVQAHHFKLQHLLATQQMTRCILFATGPSFFSSVEGCNSVSLGSMPSYMSHILGIQIIRENEFKWLVTHLCLVTFLVSQKY